MKFRIASFALVLSVLLAAPAMASTLYTNGPINGTLTGYNICCMYTVADSFTLSGNSTVTGFDGGFWVEPGTIPVSATWVIASTLPDFLGGNVVASGSANFSNSLYCSACPDNGGFDIYTSTISGLNVSLGAGTYYLELRNSLTNFGTNVGVFWDRNDGPSTAYQDRTFSIVGIPSQAFNIYGTGGTTTPEPGTLVLFGSGVAGLAGMLRRKTNQ